MIEEPEDEIVNKLHYLADRSNLLFAYHFCVIEFQGDKDIRRDPSESDRAWRLQTIQDACLSSSLIALRDLDDFFMPRTKKSRQDDLKASDLGIDIALRFLTPDEHILINKLIAHTTQVGFENTGFRWDLLELISKAIAQCCAFLECIKEKCKPSLSSTWLAATAIQAKSKAILKAIQNEGARQQAKAEPEFDRNA